MKLIKGKQPLYDKQYRWMATTTSPHKMVASFTDVSDIVCAVAGLKPLIVNKTLWGKLPGKEGFISFYTSTDSVYEAASIDPNSYYYWERNPPKHRQVDPIMPSIKEGIKGASRTDEPWHKWSESKIQDKIINICEQSKYTNYPIDEICLMNELSHWGFEALFQSRYPEQFYEYKTSKKIPTRDQLTKTLAKRFPFMSCTS